MHKFIDNENEHNDVLYELGLLDDADNYELYVKMQSEQQYNLQDFDLDAQVEEYIIKNKIYYPNTPKSKSELIYLCGIEDKKKRIFIIFEKEYNKIAHMLALEKSLAEKPDNKQQKI